MLKELRMEIGNIVQKAMIKTIPKKKKCKKAKWLPEEALQRAVKRRDVKGKGEKERYTQVECRRLDAFELWCWRRFLRVLGLQGVPTSPSYRRSVLSVHWKD